MKKILFISALLFIIIGCSPVEEDTRLICDCSDTSYEFKYTKFDQKIVNDLSFFVKETELNLPKIAVNRPTGVISKNACSVQLDNNVLIYNKSKNKFIWNGKDTGNTEYGNNDWGEDFILSTYSIQNDQSYLFNKGTTTSNELLFNRVNLTLQKEKEPILSLIKMIGNSRNVTKDGLILTPTKEILEKRMQITYKCRVVEGI